jgi:plasminogen activator inhibitor 1 RNA-binding protein
MAEIATKNAFEALSSKKKRKTPSTPNPNPLPKPAPITVITPTPTPPVPAAAEKVPETKQEREAKDHHLDRSNKGRRERKGGQGVGGWNETPEKTSEEAIAEATTTTTTHTQPAEEEKPENEPKPPVEPEKIMKTLDEYLAERVKVAPKVQKARKIDESVFKNMAKVEKTEELFIKKGTEQPPKAPKTVEKQPAKAVEKPPAKKPEKKVLKTFFRMPRPNRGGDRERGERRPERQENASRAPVHAPEDLPALNTNDFPVLNANAIANA